MVILANAVIPSHGLSELTERLGIELDEDGFIRAQESQSGLVATTRPGIYAAGCDFLGARLEPHDGTLLARTTRY